MIAVASTIEQNTRVSDMRLAAFARVRDLTETYGLLGYKNLKDGFSYEGERIPLHNIQQGIFKPRQMRFLLSIKTVVPRKGKKIWYEDQVTAHRQIYEREESIDYAFMGTNPNVAQNQHLREACDHEIPVIYFLGVAPGLYQALLPTFIMSWDAATLTSSISFGYPNQISDSLPEANERRYAMGEVQRRLHQGHFRESLITAYRGRCALSRLPQRQLLDAAHIVPDREELGQPIVQNGLLLSKMLHAAFDANLLGIDPDYRIHVSDQILSQRDGPMLEAVKQLHGNEIYLPKRVEDYPDKDRLDRRFAQYKDASTSQASLLVPP